MESFVNVVQYLDRIGVSCVEKPTPEYLALLHTNHLLSVPFENLDIHHDVAIVLNQENLFDKIVLRRRGGFCYELNGLFAWLLHNLGFDVSMVSGRVYDPGSSAFSPAFDHMVLFVQLTQTFLVDVGFGDCFRKPIPLSDGTVEDISGQYRIRPSRLNDDDFQVERHRMGRWEIEYSFDERVRKLEDFAQRCSFHQTSPDSHFTQSIVCTLASQEGRKTLSSENLKISKADVIKNTPIPTREYFYRLLFEHFGIRMEVEEQAQRAGR